MLLLPGIFGFAGGLKSYKDEVLDDNPIGFWLLNEVSGSTMGDYSTNVINGTYYNTPTLNQAGTGGSIDKSVFFDGSSSENGRTNANSTFALAPTSNWSMEIWFKDNNTTNTTLEVIYAVRGDTGFGDDVLGLFFINNGVNGRVSLAVPDAPASSNIVLNYDATPDNGWHQLVATSTFSGSLRLYFDGVERASSSTARNGNTVNKRAVVAANWNATVPQQYATANLAAVSLYNTTLSAQRISDHYEAGK